MNVVKQLFIGALKPIQSKMASIEEKSIKTNQKEEVDMSKLLKPLTSKLDDIEEQITQTDTDSVRLKEKFDGIAKNIKDTTAANQVVGSTVAGIKNTAQQIEKHTAGLTQGFNEAIQDVKKFSGKHVKLVSKDAVKQVAQEVKDGVKDDVQEATEKIKKNVESALQSSDDSQKTQKTVTKNQKYLKRIYKDLHHLHHR